MLVRIVLVAIAAFAIWFAVKTWTVVRTPAIPQTSSLTINDVSQLNPIQVSEVIAPTTTDEIVAKVKTHPGPISIGGARHSMGGQTATAGALFIDMRRFNRVLAFSPNEKTITVQTGITFLTNCTRPSSNSCGLIRARLSSSP